MAWPHTARPPLAAPTPPGPPRRDAGRARRIAVAVIVAVVLVAGAGAVFLWTGGGGGTAGSGTPADEDHAAAVESLGAAEVAWQVRQGIAPEAVPADDHWVTDDHLVRRLPGRVVAYALATGEQAWVLDIADGAVRSTPKPDAACESTKAALFGKLLLAQAECDNGQDSGIRLRAFDEDIEMVWEWATPKGEDGSPLPVLGVLSVDPLVVEIGHSGRDTQLMRVDPKSGKTVLIEEYTGGVRGDFMSACDGWAMGVCELGRVVDGKVVLTTVPDQVNPDDPGAAPGQRSTEFRNELVAFALATGDQAWRTGVVAGRTLGLVRTADGGLAAYQPENPNGSKGLLFSVDPGTGALAPLLAIGPKAHDNDALNAHLRSQHFRGDNQLALWRDGLFVIFKGVHRASTTDDVDTVAFAVPK